MKTECLCCCGKYKHYILSPNCVKKQESQRLYFQKMIEPRVPELLLALLLSWMFWACRLPVSFCLCCGIFCLTDSSDEKCQTWLPPEPTHLWPWPHQPWPSQRSQFPFYWVCFGCYGEERVFFFLFTNCFHCPVLPVPVAAFCRAEWALRLEQYGGDKEGSRFHISALLD